MEKYCRIQSAIKVRRIFLLIQCAIFLSLGFSPLSIADVTSSNPVYCHQGECLHCDSNRCAMIPADSDEQTNVDYEGDNNLSFPEADELFSNLMEGPASLEPGDETVSSNLQPPQKINTSTPQTEKKHAKKQRVVLKKASKGKTLSQPILQKNP